MKSVAKSVTIMFPHLLLLFSLFANVLSKSADVCDLSDEKCITERAIPKHKKMVLGQPGVEPSDPIYRNLINVNLPTLNYKLLNAAFTGMKDCDVELLKISPKDLKYSFRLGCPNISIKSEYEIKGDLGPEFVEGSGTCTIEHYDFHLSVSGDYTKGKGKDDKIYIQLKSHKLEMETKGKVLFNFQNLFYGDKEKSDAVHKFMNENSNLVDKLIGQPVIKEFLNSYLINIKAFLTIVPLADLFAVN